MTDIRKKVEHVLSAPNFRRHHCHWPDCPTLVAPALWGCRKHWYMLPPVLRSRIWAAYKIQQELTLSPSPEYIAVAKETQEWIKKNFPNE